VGNRGNAIRLLETHGHPRVEGKPTMAAMVSSKFSETAAGGWSFILSGLESLLETGQPCDGFLRGRSASNWNARQTDVPAGSGEAARAYGS
jgi:hypothetical protein